RHPELFTQHEQDRFKLASLDVDILCGLATSWLPADTVPPPFSIPKPAAAAAERRNERIAADIVEFLRAKGPQPISRIRPHLYGRFIGQASADVVIATDARQRFLRLGSGLIGLRPDADDAPMIIDQPPRAWHRA